jgi:hypothetical protein
MNMQKSRTCFCILLALPLSSELQAVASEVVHWNRSQPSDRAKQRGDHRERLGHV